MKTKTTDSKTLTFAVGTRSSMVAAEDVWFQRKRCNVVVPTGRRVGMRLNKPGLECSCRASEGAIDDEGDRPGTSESCPTAARGKLCGSRSSKERKS